MCQCNHYPRPGEIAPPCALRFCAIVIAVAAAGITSFPAFGEANLLKLRDDKSKVLSSIRENLQEASANFLGQVTEPKPPPGPLGVVTLHIYPGVRQTGLMEVAVLQARMGDAGASRKSLAQAKDLKIVNGNRVIKPKADDPNTLGKLATSYAQVGDVEQARATLATLAGAESRDYYLRECAIILASTGKAKEALALAKQRSLNQPPFGESVLLRHLALYYASAGDWKETRRTLDQIPEADRKVKTLAGILSTYAGLPGPYSYDVPTKPGIALIQHKAGDHAGARLSIELALEIAAGIKDAKVQARERATIACVQALIGDLVGARKTLEQIPAAAENREFAQVALARAQAASGQRKEALEKIVKLGTPLLRAYGLSEVIMGHGQAGDAKAAQDAAAKALKIIEELPQEEHREMLVRLSRARAMANDLSGALQTASMQSRGDMEAYVYIAEAQAQAGDMKGALGTLNDHVRAKSLVHHFVQALARLRAEGGGEKEALAWARELTTPEERGFALLGVVEGMMKKHKVGTDSSR
jgi:tetratricopeptide (TPR) repeat protein